MFDFIPIAYYNIIYFNIILLFIIVSFLHTKSASGFSKSTHNFNTVSMFLLMVFLILYIGFRPVSGMFVDMVSYAKMFDKIEDGSFPPIVNDYGFFITMQFLVKFHSKTFFFFVLSLLYIIPLYIAVKRWFKKYYFFAFLILASSFSFWAYGTNGLRNGISTSLLILAFSFYDKKWVMFILFALAFSFHSSALLPIIAYLISMLFKSSFVYFSMWLSSILLSLTMGSFWEQLMLKAGLIKEDKLLAYFGNKEEYANQFASSGFRWDFLIYSFMPVAVAYYFIFVKKIKDTFYKNLVHTYLLSNMIWILVIRASFSNRFAYLSWFMMGIIIIYPFLQKVYWKNQFSIIGLLILFYFSFTYFMNIIIY